jgi:hypothetical protein
MLWIVILEVLAVAGMAAVVLKDEKKLTASFNRWMGGEERKKIVYRVPLHLVVREEIKAKVEKAVKQGPKHRYVH